MSSDQVHSLHNTLYAPKNTAKATLLIVHGMTEHSGRYEKFAQYLAEQDIAVLTYDQLGHGRRIIMVMNWAIFLNHIRCKPC